MSLSPSLAEVIERAIDSRISALRTCFPATVVSYDTATQTAKLRPAVKAAIPLFSDEDVDVIETLPDLPEVPVLWPGGGTSWLICNLAPGDAVLVLVGDTDFSAWWRTGSAGEPEDRRQHDMSFAFALPVVRRPSQQINSPQPSMQLGSAADAPALASALDGALGAVATLPTLAPTATTAELATAVNAIKACFAAWANPAYSCGSSMIKVQQ